MANLRFLVSFKPPSADKILYLTKILLDEYVIKMATKPSLDPIQTKRSSDENFPLGARREVSPSRRSLAKSKLIGMSREEFRVSIRYI